jgi:hypothetical protein
MLLDSLIDCCDQLGCNWDDPQIQAMHFLEVVHNTLFAGFRPTALELQPASF